MKPKPTWSTALATASVRGENFQLGVGDSIFWPALILACGLAAAYSNSFSGPFVFDDLPAIVENTTLRSPVSPTALLHPPAHTTVAGRPLLNVSFALNYRFGGNRVAGYHAANLAVHFLAALSLLGIVRRTVAVARNLSFNSKPATRLGLAVAGLWALNPIQTEAVTYVVQRAESLAGLLFFFTIYCFIRSATGRSTGWSCLSVVSCWAGVAVKETMWAAPVAVWTYDAVFISGGFRAAGRNHWKLLSALMGSWLLLGVLVFGNSARGGSVGLAPGFSVGDLAFRQLALLGHYGRCLLWPDPLIFDYGDAVRASPAYAVAGLTLLLSAGALALYCWRRARGLAYPAIWLILVLVPSACSIPILTQPFAEHRLYLALAAPVALAAVALERGFRRSSGVVVISVAVIWGVMTVRRNEIYHSALSLWTDTVEHNPGNARAHDSLGLALAAAGKPEAALSEHRVAVRESPGDARLHDNLGRAEAESGNFAAAGEEFKAAIRLRPDFAQPHYNLGNLSLRAGEFPEASAEFAEAERLQPDFAASHANHAVALVQAGNRTAALAEIAEALRLDPSAENHFNFALVLFETHSPSAAIEQLFEANRLRPDFAEAQARLASALAAVQRDGEAERWFESALQLRPRDASTAFDFGSLLARQHRIDPAILWFRVAVAEAPGDVEARARLEFLLAAKARENSVGSRD